MLAMAQRLKQPKSLKGRDRIQSGDAHNRRPVGGVGRAAFPLLARHPLVSICIARIHMLSYCIMGLITPLSI